MGLSRNKVAVSEGAAGSPPFYGDREALRKDASYNWFQINRNEKRKIEINRVSDLLFNFQGLKPEKNRIQRVVKTAGVIRGCSSDGRAPALQAGGQGFDSPHLHH